MRGLSIAVKVILFFAYFNTGLAMPPVEVPLQYGQFCETQKLSGQGLAKISMSIQDYEIGLGYDGSMAGNGNFEVDQVHEYSQNAEKLQRRVDALNNTSDSSLNLFGKLKLAYSGSTPLIGENYLTSAIRAEMQENFEVNEIEKDQTAFVSSTESNSTTKSLPYHNPVHTMGFDTRNMFNGTWSTDSTWHEMLYKDIKAHEKFNGRFEANKLVKFHENPATEEMGSSCNGIDC